MSFNDVKIMRVITALTRIARRPHIRRIALRPVDTEPVNSIQLLSERFYYNHLNNLNVQVQDEMQVLSWSIAAAFSARRTKPPMKDSIDKTSTQPTVLHWQRKDHNKMIIIARNRTNQSLTFQDGFREPLSIPIKQ